MEWRQQVQAALDGVHPTLGRRVVYVVYGLIFVSTLSIGVETIPVLPAWLRSTLEVAEMAVIAAFSAEYLLRIAVAPRPLRYIFSVWGLIDLVAVLPFYLSLGGEFRAVRALRLLRLFRLIKAFRFGTAVDRMAAAFRIVREELVVFGVAALIVLYLAAVGIYYFENEAQPETFSSMFASMWWAAVTLTTVGYGDSVPVTTGGRVFTVLVLLIALGVIAVPTGLISSALSRLRQAKPLSDRPDER